MTKKDQLGNFELMVMLTLMRLGENAYGVPICDELAARGRNLDLEIANYECGIAQTSIRAWR